MNKNEIKSLEKLGGRPLSVNPKTGIKEAFGLEELLGEAASGAVDFGGSSISDLLSSLPDSSIDYLSSILGEGTDALPSAIGDFGGYGFDGLFGNDYGLSSLFGGDSDFFNGITNHGQASGSEIPTSTANTQIPNLGDSSPLSPSGSSATGSLSTPTSNTAVAPNVEGANDRPFFDRALGWLGDNWKPVGLGALGIAAYLAMKNNKNKAAQQATAATQANNTAQAAAAQEQFNKPLPNYQFSRQAINPNVDWVRAGSTPGGLRFYDEAGGNYQRLAKGGMAALNEMVRPTTTAGRQTRSQMKRAMAGPTKGGGNLVPGDSPGQADDAPAMLSSGEYVIDAHTVADLGDGNTSAGAKKLDKFRDAVAKSKGRKKRVPPKAKPLSEYAVAAGMGRR